MLIKLHRHRQVAASYCNFSTSAQHSSISPRQRPPTPLARPSGPGGSESATFNLYVLARKKTQQYVWDEQT